MTDPLIEQFSRVFRSVSKREWKRNSSLAHRTKRIIQLLRQLEWIQSKDQLKAAACSSSN